MQDFEGQKYSTVAKALHWIMAALIIANIGIAKYMENLPREQRSGWLYQHKAIGTLVLLLIIWRLYWRFTHKPPALDASTPPLMAFAAHAAHWTLYAMMVLVPLSGFLQNALRGRDVGMWIVTIPAFLGENRDVAKIFSSTHDIVGNLMMLLVIFHIVAALYHQFFKRDGLINRMLA